MTTWPEEDTSADDGFEFYDPTAPRAEETGAAETPAEERMDVDVVAGADLPEGVDEDARSDPSGAVHLWIDDQKRVTGVRVSNRWRERLRREKKSLAEVVLKLISGNQVMAGVPLWSPSSADLASASPLNGAALERLLNQSMTLDGQAKELQARDDVRPTRFTGEPAEGWSENRKVHVRLDLHARTVQIDIDDDWAQQSKAEATGEAILQAHLDAYGRWTPPEVEPGEWDLLNAERTAIRDEIMAMFRNGI